MRTHLDDLICRYPKLKPIEKDIAMASKMLCDCIDRGGKILIAGNGGSCSDSDHIVGELMKSFTLQRSIDSKVAQALIEVDPVEGKLLSETLEGTIRAHSLINNNALVSAFSNDREFSVAVAQQVYGYGDEGDVFIGLSTSGNSRNIVYAAITAKAKGLKVISLTGADPARLDSLSDCSVKVPETETYKVQELHLPIYHSLCLMLEQRFFGSDQ